MKPKEIRAALKPLGILQGINCYPDEPSPLFHYVVVKKGHGNEAITTLKTTGGDAMWVPACSHIYGDNIQVRR